MIFLDNFTNLYIITSSPPFFIHVCYIITSTHRKLQLTTTTDLQNIWRLYTICRWGYNFSGFYLTWIRPKTLPSISPFTVKIQWKSNLCCMLDTNVHWFVCLFVCLFLEDKKKNKDNDICSWVKWLVSNYQNLYLAPTLRGIKQNKWSINT